MAYKNRVKIDAIRSAAFGAIGANYSAVGAVLADPARILILNNLTDADVYFSIDGTNNHFILPPRSFKLIDITTNKVRDDGFFLAEQGYIWVKHTGVAPTVGSVYIEVIHA